MTHQRNSEDIVDLVQQIVADELRGGGPLFDRIVMAILPPLLSKTPYAALTGDIMLLLREIRDIDEQQHTIDSSPYEEIN